MKHTPTLLRREQDQLDVAGTLMNGAAKFTSFMPHGSRVLVRPNPLPEKSDGGILLPPSVMGSKQEHVITRLGVIVAVGAGLPASGTGQIVPMPFVAGQTVAYQMTRFLTTVEIDKQTYVVLDQSEIIGTFS